MTIICESTEGGGGFQALTCTVVRPSHSPAATRNDRTHLYMQMPVHLANGEAACKTREGFERAGSRKCLVVSAVMIIGDEKSAARLVH